MWVLLIVLLCGVLTNILKTQASVKPQAYLSRKLMGKPLVYTVPKIGFIYTLHGNCIL